MIEIVPIVIRGNQALRDLLRGARLHQLVTPESAPLEC